MIKTNIYCDCCGKEIKLESYTPITGDQFTIDIELHWYSPYGRSTNDGYNHQYKYELCKECSTKFDKKLKYFLENCMLELQNNIKK